LHILGTSLRSRVFNQGFWEEFGDFRNFGKKAGLEANWFIPRVMGMVGLGAKNELIPRGITVDPDQIYRPNIGA